jgi:hypothetical protein
MATRAIDGIWKGGVRFDRAAYATRARATRAVATNAPVEPGIVSTFDDGTTTSRFGLGWMISNDDMAGMSIAPMQPANLSAAKEIAFWARGDGKRYRVMLFAQSRGMAPATRTFEVTAEWKEYSFPLSAFATDGKDVVMLIIGAGPAPGPFEIFIDNVRLR